MWKVKSIRQNREEQRIREQEIDTFEAPVLYYIAGHIAFWTVMILVGFILGLIWAAVESK